MWWCFRVRDDLIKRTFRTRHNLLFFCCFTPFVHSSFSLLVDGRYASAVNLLPHSSWSHMPALLFLLFPKLRCFAVRMARAWFIINIKTSFATPFFYPSPGAHHGPWSRSRGARWQMSCCRGPMSLQVGWFCSVSHRDGGFLRTNFGFVLWFWVLFSFIFEPSVASSFRGKILCFW